MKRLTLFSAGLLLAFAGCTCGQGGRPNFLTRLQNRFHGNSNVGAPCDAGQCESQMSVEPSCDGCGSTESANFGGFEGNVISSSEGMSVGQTFSSVPSSTFSSSPNTYVPTTPSSSRFGAETVTPRAAN